MRPIALVPIFETHRAKATLAPYVPAVNDRGEVAFVVTAVDGTTSLWVTSERGRELRFAAPAGSILRLVSHPDHDDHGVLTVYAERTDGRLVLLRADDRDSPLAAFAPSGWREVGPLGPAMNDRGAVAVRGFDADGHAGAFVVDGPEVRWSIIATLDGLPLVDRSGALVVHAREAGGGSRLLRVDDHGCDTVLAATSEGEALGRFASVAECGDVGIALERAGVWSYVRVESGGAREVREVLRAGAFPDVRGGKIVDRGTLAIYATPAGGGLGVYTAADPRTPPLVAMGREAFGAPVVDLALNPVSGSESGHLAVRLALADGREIVARTDRPIEPW